MFRRRDGLPFYPKPQKMIVKTMRIKNDDFFEVFFVVAKAWSGIVFHQLS